MAYVLRLLVGLAFWFLLASAHALVPKVQWEFKGASSDPWVSSASSACSTWMDTLNLTDTSYIHSLNSVSVGSDGVANGCYQKLVNRSNGAVANPNQLIALTKRSVTPYCPSNSSASGTGCACNQGYGEDSTHTFCVGMTDLEQFCQQHAAAKNTFNQWGTVGRSSPMPTASCYKPDPPFEGPDAAKGCQTVLKDVIAAPREGDPALKDWSATGVMTGATCEDALATDAAPKSSDDPCPNGFPGTVNGQQRCIAVEPDKGIEGVKGTSQTTADGTKIDTKETTKCEGSICTTTTNTTTTTSGGTVTNSTTSRTESLSDKCAKDPKNDVCKKTQGGAGGATSSMTCDVNSSAEGCGGEGAAIGELYTKKDKTVGQVLTKAKNDLQSSQLGSSVTNFFNVGGGGSCPSISGTVPYVNAAFTFDAYCGSTASKLFLILRTVLVMVATWAAFRIAIDN